MVGLRLIVVDADLPKRLATELNRRGRPAVSTAEIGFYELKDPALLAELAAKYAREPWVLITGDDAMPGEHGGVIQQVRATVATIHPEHPDGMTQDAWRRDITHRWAHAFQTQSGVRRYKASGSRPWTPRQRHIRAAAAGGWTPWTPWSAERPERAPVTDPEPADSADQTERLPGFT